MDEKTDWADVASGALDALQKLDFTALPKDAEIWAPKLAEALASFDDYAQGRLPEVFEPPPPVVIEVPEPAKSPQLNPVEVREAQLLEQLEDAGYGASIGRILIITDHTSTRPLAVVPHREGLPEFDVVLAPQVGSAPGALGVFISEHSIFLAMVVAPVDTHPWRIERTVSFTNSAELLALLPQFTGGPTNS